METKIGDKIRICIPAYKPCGQVIPAKLSLAHYSVHSILGRNQILVMIGDVRSLVKSWVRV